MLRQERFRWREEEIKAHGTKPLERHQTMSEGYSRALEEYLSLAEALTSGGVIEESFISDLQSLLNRIRPKEKRPIFGSLPYRNLKYPAREPSFDTAIKPAYWGGDRTVSSYDLKNIPKAPIPLEISSLAQETIAVISLCTNVPIYGRNSGRNGAFGLAVLRFWKTFSLQDVHMGTWV